MTARQSPETVGELRAQYEKTFFSLPLPAETRQAPDLSMNASDAWLLWEWRARTGLVDGWSDWSMT